MLSRYHHHHSNGFAHPTVRLKTPASVSQLTLHPPLVLLSLLQLPLQVINLCSVRITIITIVLYCV